MEPYEPKKTQSKETPCSLCSAELLGKINVSMEPLTLVDYNFPFQLRKIHSPPKETGTLPTYPLQKQTARIIFKILLWSIIIWRDKNLRN